MRTKYLPVFILILLASTAAFAADGDSQYAKLDGARIHYKSYGKGRDAIVLVHGWTCNLDNWRDQIPEFAKRNRVIALDLPGHGQSDKPEIAYTMDLFANAIDAVMRDAKVERAVVMGGLDGASEVLLVDDGSNDRSLEMMRDLHQRDPRVRYVSLARNFGHQIAVTAGLVFARGDAVIVLDADLQDPPELIPTMIEKWRAGYHVVYAQHISRQRESVAKKVFAYVFYRFLRLLTNEAVTTSVPDTALVHVYWASPAAFV